MVCFAAGTYEGSGCPDNLLSYMASSDAHYTCVTECPTNKGYRYDSTT